MLDMLLGGLVVLLVALLAWDRFRAALARSRMEALTDPLTGLGNRRHLMRDLAEAMRAVRRDEEPRALLLYDLDGFKDYNDTFGHPAGDALLTRMGQALVRASAPFGRAYRIGGDEFCVVAETSGISLETVKQLCGAALSDHGEGFRVGASCGATELRTDDQEPSAALRRADRELYRHKRTRSAASRQMVDVLLRALDERQPALSGRGPGVAMLAGAVAERLGLSTGEVDEVVRAAQLRDIGKLGIPDGILGKPGPLTQQEIAYVREHTIIGERILNVAPALTEVGRIVRASHERWDGTGYPDGLAGEDIPLAARIVAACDAYAAMTSKRPHRPAIAPEAAAIALHNGAAAQFDPAVVAALLEEVDAARVAQVAA
jgi:two-component system, cell cycle response regulator